MTCLPASRSPLDALQVQRRDGGVGDDGDLAAVHMARQQRAVVEQAGPMEIG
jgi:hypothetical protein